jgi:hypothetical protein
MDKQKQHFVIQDRVYLNLFKVLLKPVDKAKPYAFILYVEREQDGRLVYVCTDGRRMHVLRIPSDFGFFEPDNSYLFTVTGKEAAFEKLGEGRRCFPSWRKYVPKSVRRVARAAVSKYTRTQCLMGFYHEGIYIDAGHLADLEILCGEWDVFVEKNNPHQTTVFKLRGPGYEFEAVIMPVSKAGSVVVLEADAPQERG